MIKSSHSVCKGSSLRSSNKRNSWSFLFSILVVLLPKCSLCVTAYTGAIAMCSGKTLMGKMGSTGHFVFLLLSLIILISVATKKRGKRTLLSLALVFISLLLIGLSESQVIWKAGYYLGSLGLFIGIWVNGSLFYILRKSKEHYHIIKSKLPTA